MKLRDQVVQVAPRFDCRWIGQPVERCPDNQHAQQTCRDFGSYGLVALCIYPSGKGVTYGHWSPAEPRTGGRATGGEDYVAVGIETLDC